jgi:hypothetical protein
MTNYRMMNIHRAALALSWTIAVGFAAFVLAQQQPVVSSRLQKAEATVTAIDPATREVSLDGPNGPFSVVVSHQLKNFDKVHVGDKVVVSYYEGVAARMAKNGGKAAEPASSTFAYRNHAGDQPGGGAGMSTTGTVTIQAVDPSTNTVAFMGADGMVHIIAVRSPNMQHFVRTLKPGDKVEVTYTQSIAVNVVPQPR